MSETIIGKTLVVEGEVSGTEPLLRILVEARSAEDVRRWGDHIENSARMESKLGVDPRGS